MRQSKTKKLGQHFLRDKSVLRKIIRTISPQQDDFIIEIGAGKGVLTFALAQKAGQIIAIEKDKTLIPHLEAKNVPNLNILEADVLTVRFTDLLVSRRTPQMTVKLVGNLPYVISSPILLKVLEEREALARCVFLLQKEVGKRISAQPGTKSYAPLSLRLQNEFVVRLCYTVEPDSFSPPPRVKSALISLEKRPRPLFRIANEESFSKFLKTAFRHRRKTLLNNFLLAGYSRSQLEPVAQTLDLPQNIRPEHLTLSQYVELFNLLMKNGIIKD